MKQTLWPCKSIAAVTPGLRRVRIYDDQSSEVEVELSKLKPFTPVSRIPRSRTAEWRRGYEKALQEIES